MRNFTLFLALLFCATVGATAQDGAGAFSPSTPISSPVAATGLVTPPWQLNVGYQYNRIAVPKTFEPFNTSGLGISITRYFSSAVGVEGEVGNGFGMAAPGVSAYSIFAGAGPRLIFLRRSHFEPWVHGLAGIEHFNFAGATFPGTTTSVGWVMGGGMDYRFDSGWGLRLQGDYLGSALGGVYQRNIQIVGGVTWNFWRWPVHSILGRG